MAKATLRWISGRLSWKFPYIWVGLLALGLRCPHAMVASRSLLVQHPQVDAGYHHQKALERIRGSGEKMPYFKPPYYPYLLSVAYRFSGGEEGCPGAIPYVQAGVGVLSCLWIVSLSNRLFGRKSAWGAGLLAAMYKPFLLFEGQLLASSFTLFLLLLSCWFLLRRKRMRCLGGLALGLAAGMRPNLLLCLPMVGGWQWIHSKDKASRLSTAAFVVLSLLPTGVTFLRNGLVAGEWVPISTNAGINLYTAWRPEADGVSAIEPGYEWEKTMRFPKSIGFEKEGEISRYWVRRALADIKEAPGRTVALSAKKALWFWSGREIRNNIGLHAVASLSPVTRLPLPGFSLLLPLALAGAAVGGVRKQAFLPLLFLLGIYLSVLPFFVCGRFRLSAVPFLFPWAGLAVSSVFERFRTGDLWTTQGFRSRCIPFLLALMGLCLTQAPPAWIEKGKPHRDLWILAVAHLEAKDPVEAARLARKGLEMAERDPDLWTTLGNALLHLKDYQGAQEAYENALTWAPDYAVARGNLSTALLHLGRTSEALAFARQAHQLAPHLPGPPKVEREALRRLGRSASR